MNEHVAPKGFQPSQSRPLQCERRRFTADELQAMGLAGVIGPEERVELIDGEIIAMAAKGARHEDLRNELSVFWARRLPPELRFAEEPAFRLDAHTEPEPDIIIFPDRLRTSEVRGDTVLLVVEVSDSSLSYDLMVKAPKYARFGVRDYWVVDATTYETHVHRGPGPDGYGDVTVFSMNDVLTPLLVPELTVRLGDLRLG